MRISDWSSAVCSSDLSVQRVAVDGRGAEWCSSGGFRAGIALMADPVLDHAEIEDPEERSVFGGRIGCDGSSQHGHVEQLPGIEMTGFEKPEHFRSVSRVERTEIGRASCRERVCKYV